MNLGKVPGVEKCEVSVKEGRARLFLREGAEVDIETLKAKVIESGFTPGEATVSSTSR